MTNGQDVASLKRRLVSVSPANAGAWQRAIAATASRRVLVVCRRSDNANTSLMDALSAEGIKPVTFAVKGEPTIQVAEAGARLAGDNRCELVIGFGGGSVRCTLAEIFLPRSQDNQAPPAR